ncbi:UNVERIFIED_CONTAM: hypothetical protein H355_001563 [Colinus virginianus]|nr:hypothetical protein H355_001563 [Colinus virginianus]
MSASSKICLAASAIETAERTLAPEDGPLDVVCSALTSARLRHETKRTPETLLPSTGSDHCRRPCLSQPAATLLPFPPSQKPLESRSSRHTTRDRGQCWDLPFPRLETRADNVVSSNESEQIHPAVKMTHPVHQREENPSSGFDLPSYGVSGEDQLQMVETTAAARDKSRDVCEKTQTITGGQETAPEVKKPKKLTFVGSWRHDLIRHLMRLKRRSDIRRECGSILLLGYPLIRFMCSPWFYRLASRQGGGLLPAMRSSDITPYSVLGRNAEEGSTVHNRGQSTNQADRSSVKEQNNADGPVNESPKCSTCAGESSPGLSPLKDPEVGSVKFDLIVTDNAALVKSPSLHLIHCSEAVQASPTAVNFLMRRDVPEYFRMQGRGALKISGRKRINRKNEGMLSQKSILTGARNITAVAVLERPTEKQELQNVRCLLALDRVKYVGNLGVLVRAAAAFGFDGIFYIDGTADPFNWKVMEKLQNVGINATDISKLKLAGYCTVLSVIQTTRKDLLLVKGLSEAKVEKIVEAATKLEMCNTFITGAELVQKRARVVKLSSGTE